MMNYTRLTEGLNKSILVPENEDISKYIRDNNKDYYKSVFIYNDKHFEEFKKTHSVAGIRDVFTNKLIFDFDSKEENLEQARKDLLEAAVRLVEKGINEEAVQVFFSGSKGFHLEVQLNKELSLDTLKAIAYNISQDLVTFDTSIYDAARVIRVVNTKHQKTNLFKIPLTAEEVYNLTIEEIKSLAKTPRLIDTSKITISELPSSLQDLKLINVQKTANLEIKKIEGISDLNWERKPSQLSNCRFALQNGLFDEGNRWYAFLVLAATYKNQGFEFEVTLGMLTGVAELQSKIYKLDQFEDDQLEKIVSEVYSPKWQGGQFTCKKPGNFLYDYCKSLGTHKCSQDISEESSSITTNDIFNSFQQYALNYEKNILFTGIKSLDEHWRLMVGTFNGMVASAGAGKTSVVLQMLQYQASKGIPTLFLSYDMYKHSLYNRMIQQVTGKSFDEIFYIFKNKPNEANLIKQKVNEAFKGIEICFKTGQTIPEIRRTIRETQDRIGKKIKFVILDYNELVASDKSDATQASGEIAIGLTEIAKNEEVCVLTLLQPTKVFANPADDFTTYQAAKGSSLIQQQLTTLIGISRPGYNPQDKSGLNDQYLNITGLKNRNGGSFSIDFRWNGKQGLVSELEDGDEILLKQIREERDLRKTKSGLTQLLTGSKP